MSCHAALEPTVCGPRTAPSPSAAPRAWDALATDQGSQQPGSADDSWTGGRGIGPAVCEFVLCPYAGFFSLKIPGRYRRRDEKRNRRVQLTISTSAEKPLPPPSSLKSEPSADATKVFSESYCSRTLEVSCRTAWRERKVRQMVAAMGLRTARSTPTPQQSHSPFSTWGAEGACRVSTGEPQLRRGPPKDEWNCAVLASC